MIPVKLLALCLAHGGGTGASGCWWCYPYCCHSHNPSYYYLWQSQAAPWGPRELQESQVPELHRLFPQLHHNSVSVPRESIQELLHHGCLSPVSC